MSDGGERGWFEFQLGGPPAALELFADFTTELGSGGAVFSEDPARPGGQMATAFISAAAAGPDLWARVRERVARLDIEFPGTSATLKVTKVEDRDWAKDWQESLAPERLAPGIWIVPTLCEVPAEAHGEPVIRMDPGMAFGAGGHETTRMCVAQVAKAVRAGASEVLDLGTGTGVLAMTAALFGAKKVKALDIDPVALRVAEENVRGAGLEDKIELERGVSDPEGALDGETFDLVVANLFPEALFEMLPLIARCVKPLGLAVVSGVLAERRDEVVSVVREKGFEVEEKIEEQEWVTLLLREGRSG